MRLGFSLMVFICIMGNLVFFGFLRVGFIHELLGRRLGPMGRRWLGTCTFLRFTMVKNKLRRVFSVLA